MNHPHCRLVRHAAAGASLLLTLAAGSAAAQASTLMDAYWREVLQGEGFTTLLTSPSGALRDNAVQDFAVSMVRGADYAFFATCDADCDDVDLIVLGPDGRELAADRSADDAPTIRVRATASGTHTLRVSMASCTSEPCSFWARGYGKPRAATSAATGGAERSCEVTETRRSIAQGESISASLDAQDCLRADDSHARYYRLVLAARDSVTITMASNAFDAYLVLQDSRGQNVETDDDGAGGRDARIDRTLDAGTYYVIANSLSAGGTGAFRLHVSPPRRARTTGTPAAASASGSSGSASTQTIDLSSHRTWFTGPSSSGRCAYAYSDGGYRIDILSPATCYPAQSASAGASVAFTGDDVRLSVTYRSISGADVRPGISFGREADGSRYVFSMSTSGEARLSRWDGSSWTTLLSDTNSPHANTGLGAANMLSVELDGTTVRLFVNGNLLARQVLAGSPARNFTASLQGGSAVFQRLDVRPVTGG